MNNLIAHCCVKCGKKVGKNNRTGLCLRCSKIGKYRSERVEVKCPDCGRVKIVTKSYLFRRKSSLCHNCYAKRHILELNTVQVRERNPFWKGGVFKSGNYVAVSLPKNHSRIKMAGKGERSVLQHRLVMANHLNRDLESWEVVHHKNGNKRDNRRENLELLTHANHLQVTKLQQRVIELESRISELENIIKEGKYEESVSCA
jgi:endogenous inhibitor of DNA gyrase (YacG/DUF329 family)